jgi:hypothetical protein
MGVEAPASKFTLMDYTFTACRVFGGQSGVSQATGQ